MSQNNIPLEPVPPPCRLIEVSKRHPFWKRGAFQVNARATIQCLTCEKSGIDLMANYCPNCGVKFRK